MSVYEQNAQDGARLASYPTFEDWHREAQALDGLAFIRGRTELLRGPDGNEQVSAAYISPDFFRILDRTPQIGRGFTTEELRGGGEPVAIISYDLWRRRFGSERSLVGQRLTLGENVVTVIGIMPAGFAYPDWANVWLPIGLLPASERTILQQRGLHVDSRVVGRLAQGTTVAGATASMDAIAARLATTFPAENGGWTRTLLVPITQETLGDAGTRLLMLQATVFGVLLIGCSNIVNLSLSRGLGRTRELGLRVALGASRRRVVRQLLVENGLLVVIGGLAGLALATWALDAFRATASGMLPRMDEVAVDVPVLLFVLALCVLVSLAIGLLPAARLSGDDLVGALSQGGRQAGAGQRTGRLRSGLIVAEIALAMILLTGAGLLLRSFVRLGEVPLGFEPAHLLAFPVNPPMPKYDDPARAVALYQQLQQAIRAVPGVEAVALSNHVPLSGASMTTPVVPEGWTGEREEASALFRTVSAEYFATMGIPVVRGRSLEPGDMTSGTGAMLVNEAFARRYWPGADPVGKRLTAFKSVQPHSDFGEPLDGQIVGVVGNVHHFTQEVEPTPEVYLPYLRNPPRWISLVVRTRAEPRTLIPVLTRAVRQVEPDLPVAGSRAWSGFMALDEFLSQGRAPRTLQTTLVGAFAATALLLALIGLGGVVAYTVAQRRREIAVRMALGAEPGSILRLVLGRTVLLCGLGVAIGGVGAALLTRFVAGLLFGVGATDVGTFAGAAAFLATIAVIAGWLPARRATQVDPVLSLRAE